MLMVIQLGNFQNNVPNYNFCRDIFLQVSWGSYSIILLGCTKLVAVQLRNQKTLSFFALLAPNCKP